MNKFENFSIDELSVMNVALEEAVIERSDLDILLFQELRDEVVMEISKR